MGTDLMGTKIDAMSLLLQQRRFDLIFKYLYAMNPCNYNREAYIENIHAFNGFLEDSSNGFQKQSPSDFIDIFDALKDAIKKKGFDSAIGSIPLSKEGEVIDGSHRLSICAALGLDVGTKSSSLHANWDYTFFRKRGMAEDVMDYGALEYVKLNPHAYIVNLMPITCPQEDDEVMSILQKYGFVFYKKDVWLSFNGLVNVKKISYGSFWEKATWIGSAEDEFIGAQNHARNSMGRNPLRAFVFVCDNKDNVIEAKREIRELFKIGNFSVHINDTHEEAVWLAETYFNSNTLFMINTRPFKCEDKVFDEHIEILKQACRNSGISTDRVCGAGSTPMNVFHIRHSQDLDYLSLDEGLLPNNEIISSHNKHYDLYPHPIMEIINSPRYHMYYNGVKFISLEVLYLMKSRCECPKNITDNQKIKNILRYQKFTNLFKQFRINKYKGIRFQRVLVSVLYKYNSKVRPLFLRQKLRTAEQKIKSACKKIIP